MWMISSRGLALSGLVYMELHDRTTTSRRAGAPNHNLRMCVYIRLDSGVDKYDPFWKLASCTPS